MRLRPLNECDLAHAVWGRLKGFDFCVTSVNFASLGLTTSARGEMDKVKIERTWYSEEKSVHMNWARCDTSQLSV